MCSHYQGIKERERYFKQFHVMPPNDDGRYDVWPCYPSTFIRRPREAGARGDAVAAREALSGIFGLIPHWTTDATIGRRTYNARSETVASKPSFRDAWNNGQHCIIPADAIFETDWRSGEAIQTRISRIDLEPIGIAGPWSAWNAPNGQMHSFTMLTINADQHPLTSQFHKPRDEKRMVVILPQDSYDRWLHAGPEVSMEMMRPFPADQLRTEAEAPVQTSLLA